MCMRCLDYLWTVIHCTQWWVDIDMWLPFLCVAEVKYLPLQSSIQHRQRQRTCNGGYTTHKYCSTDKQQMSRWAEDEPKQQPQFKNGLCHHTEWISTWSFIPRLMFTVIYILWFSNDLSYVHETRSLDENKVCSIFMLFHLLSAPRFRVYILNASDSI